MTCLDVQQQLQECLACAILCPGRLHAGGKDDSQVSLYIVFPQAQVQSACPNVLSVVCVREGSPTGFWVCLLWTRCTILATHQDGVHGGVSHHQSVSTSLVQQSNGIMVLLATVCSCYCDGACLLPACALLAMLAELCNFTLEVLACGMQGARQPAWHVWGRLLLHYLNPGCIYAKWPWCICMCVCVSAAALLVQHQITDSIVAPLLPCSCSANALAVVADKLAMPCAAHVGEVVSMSVFQLGGRSFNTNSCVDIQRRRRSFKAAHTHIQPSLSRSCATIERLQCCHVPHPQQLCLHLGTATAVATQVLQLQHTHTHTPAGA